jgi:hypothetical protein
MELKQELIKGLKVLDENDRDLRTLTIFCNPNFIRGPDKSVKPKILKFLNEMEIQGKINRKNKIFYWEYRKHTLDVFSLI